MRNRIRVLSRLFVAVVFTGHSLASGLLPGWVPAGCAMAGGMPAVHGAASMPSATSGHQAAGDPRHHHDCPCMGDCCAARAAVLPAVAAFALSLPAPASNVRAPAALTVRAARVPHLLPPAQAPPALRV